MIPVVPVESCTHVLAEFDCLDPLLSALRLDLGRIKCTCLSVSRKWLALGTSAGGLHLIQRDGWKQKLILTHKEGSVTQVSCCPHDEDFIAVATSQGLVVVWELHLERRGRPERVSVSWEHRGQTVTSLCWDNAALRVFAGDVGGKVSCVRAGSSKLGKGSAFVIFPIQTITTVDSRVVQLGYSDGHLVVSSLSRCYLCDTEREKFWRVGNKERDGEFGACFLQQSPAGQRGQALLYCARPGSRIWEASFGGEVLSTHQFKQLLACPPLPLVSYKNEPHFSPAQTSPQSLAFPRLLQFGDQNLLTWTDSAIYIFTPHSGQVLLWTEVKDVVEISVFRNELFCLHGDGRLSHLSLMSPERCVERLMKRENWTLATTICCMFQHTVITSRARKSLPIDRLEQLKAQLNSASQEQLIGQLEEVISKLEPLDSACSSRRSSISSHLVANSQSVRGEGDRSDISLQFLPLPFRSKPPRVALQAVRDSVSSFVKKTTEKINTLQMNADLWPRPDLREGVQGEVTATVTPLPEEVEHELNAEQSSSESELQELRAATKKAISRMCYSGLSYCISVHINSPNILRRVVEFTQASKVVEVIQKGDLLKSLRSLRELQPWNTPLLLSHLYRLYDKHGEVAVRAYPQFYPTILPSDIMAMALPSHFLPYLDNLVQSRVEQQRLCFLGSLLQPETLRQDWLELALYNDAPQKDDTLTADGQPRWHSHFFSWGYGRLLSLLIRLPADLASKQKMLEKCRTHGYWMGYLYLCRELQRRPEAFSAICRLDDMTLLEGDDGIVPQSFDEWVLLLQLSQQISSSNEAPPTSALPSSPNGSCSDGTSDSSPDLLDGSTDWSIRVSPENIILRLVRVFGPDRALTALQERGIQVDLSSRSTLVCDLLRMAEKRHRALIQTMLERCDRFLWSQQA
ncbi:Hermansky-Pudlak syndrome 5 protein [Sinocyclocheilus grahami]|uniref:Hermansky-Pudlak syndrome 5 protein n=1 Tax=Sinocyclocheilus grahami TaxID=75366 RepID=UPI0007AC9BEA|nr:PREDICTED: Hermansky-Pudlak syndrome 5 protein-like [Sinocyclocheilus grahami]